MMPSPEEVEWANAVLSNPSSAPEPLIRFVQRMDREGNVWERYGARCQLLSTYAHLGLLDEALSTLDEIEALQQEHPEEALVSHNVAQNLMAHLGEFTRSRAYVERALARGVGDIEDEDIGHWEAWFRGLLLWAQVERGEPPETIALTLKRLEVLLGASFPHPDLIPALDKLAEHPPFQESVEWLLKQMWGELAYQYRFWGLGDKNDLTRIEALLERLGTPVRNEL